MFNYVLKLDLFYNCFCSYYNIIKRKHVKSQQTKEQDFLQNSQQHVILLRGGGGARSVSLVATVSCAFLPVRLGLCCMLGENCLSLSFVIYRCQICKLIIETQATLCKLTSLIISSLSVILRMFPSTHPRILLNKTRVKYNSFVKYEAKW